MYVSGAKSLPRKARVAGGLAGAGGRSNFSVPVSVVSVVSGGGGGGGGATFSGATGAACAAVNLASTSAACSGFRRDETNR
eukprot:156685-Prorocentrum_minimum.AAC.1